MRRMTIRSALAAIAVAAAALGSATMATATPTGPCEEVTYVGVCEPMSATATLAVTAGHG